MDHPSISVAAFLKPGARSNPYSKRSLHLGMRFSSGIEGAPPGDMALMPPLKAVTSDAFPASFTDKIRRVSAYTTKNRILTRIGATLMDGPELLRQFVIRGFIMESANLVQALRNDEALETYIKRASVGVWHCSCSCRMGAPDDPMAVTDNEGRVYGVHGLRVVDASIFPVVPCANTNFPTMMVAEKIADEILRMHPVPRVAQEAAIAL
jgi:5-(hydroxymethyl)furfural/furfural oxidase